LSQQEYMKRLLKVWLGIFKIGRGKFFFSVGSFFEKKLVGRSTFTLDGSPDRNKN